MSEGGAYDPTLPEGEIPRGSQYVSKRDFRVILIALAVLAVFLWPIYSILERRSQRALCAQNLKSIQEAVFLYAASKDDRLPPIMVEALPNVPELEATGGVPYTWASDIQPLMNTRAKLTCPAATPEEVGQISVEGGQQGITYGMYMPYGGYPLTSIESRSSTVILAETSNRGARDTFDPFPLLDRNGNPSPSDSFAIGWSNTNDYPDQQSTHVTRLAFPDTKSGAFKKDGPSRHDEGIHAINAEGARLILKPEQAFTRPRLELPQGLWSVPPRPRRR